MGAVSIDQHHWADGRLGAEATRGHNVTSEQNPNLRGTGR